MMNLTATAVVTSLAIWYVVFRFTRSSSKAMAQRRAIPSPRDTLLPSLSNSQAAGLPYPPDFLPGARDADTPYGVMRIYEWGPDDGRKVIMIHGDTTPGPMLGPIAQDLAKAGSRVMVFGMFV